MRALVKTNTPNCIFRDFNQATIVQKEQMSRNAALCRQVFTADQVHLFQISWQTHSSYLPCDRFSFSTPLIRNLLGKDLVTRTMVQTYVRFGIKTYSAVWVQLLLQNTHSLMSRGIFFLLFLGLKNDLLCILGDTQHVSAEFQVKKLQKCTGSE